MISEIAAARVELFHVGEPALHVRIGAQIATHEVTTPPLALLPWPGDVSSAPTQETHRRFCRRQPVIQCRRADKRRAIPGQDDARTDERYAVMTISNAILDDSTLQNIACKTFGAQVLSRLSMLGSVSSNPASISNPTRLHSTPSISLRPTVLTKASRS